jgi:hypothetical protein
MMFGISVSIPCVYVCGFSSKRLLASKMLKHIRRIVLIAVVDQERKANQTKYPSTIIFTILEGSNATYDK